MSGSDSEDAVHHQFKVIILGDGAVGKTSITQRFTNDEFKQSYLQTIGVDWFIKTIELPGEIDVSLQIWDIGGQQLGSKLLTKYIYGSDCVMLAYDITNYASFKNLQEWFKMVQRVFPEKKPLICLVANKNDLNHLRAVRKEVHDQWVTENHLESFNVSAKTGDGIRKMFFEIGAALAGVKLPKASKETVGSVVKAQIVNHPLIDAENETHHQREQQKIESIVHGKGGKGDQRKKGPCTIS